MRQPKAFPNLERVDESKLSKHALELHLKLYSGYVNKLNEMEEKLKTADRTKAAATYSEYGELKRQEPFSANGIILHEIFFSSLGGDGAPSGKALELIERDFGSFEAWKNDFAACAMASRGWSVLAFDASDSKLHNYLVDFHHFGAVWNTIPLLVLDVFEHAYFIDYGTDRKTYIDNVMTMVDWNSVNEKMNKIKL